MSDTAISQRAARAKQKAEHDLESTGYTVVHSDNRRVCLIGIRTHEVRLVKVCLDKITANDTTAIQSIPVPTNCSREIWLRKEGSSGFEIHKL